MHFLAEKDVVRKVLDDLRDHHEPFTKDHLGFLWQFDVYGFGRYDRWRDEPSKQYQLFFVHIVRNEGMTNRRKIKAPMAGNLLLG